MNSSDEENAPNSAFLPENEEKPSQTYGFNCIFFKRLIHLQVFHHFAICLQTIMFLSEPFISQIFVPKLDHFDFCHHFVRFGAIFGLPNRPLERTILQSLGRQKHASI